MEHLLRSLNVFWRSERLLAEYQFKQGSQRIQLNALAALVAVFGLAMLSYHEQSPQVQRQTSNSLIWNSCISHISYIHRHILHLCSHSQTSFKDKSSLCPSDRQLFCYVLLLLCDKGRLIEDFPWTYYAFCHNLTLLF